MVDFFLSCCSEQKEVIEILRTHGVDDDTEHLLWWENMMNLATLSSVTADMVAKFELTETQQKMLNSAIQTINWTVKIRYI